MIWLKNRVIKRGKMLIYKKMSLFDAPTGSILVHACNAQGVWGHGIAKKFFDKFPDVYEEHHSFCEQFTYNSKRICGIANLIRSKNKPYWIGNLITSEGFGYAVSGEDEILHNTRLAVIDLILKIRNIPITTDIEIYSNKFNSGLFRVPWEKTEQILKKIVDTTKVNWTVCCL